MVNLIWAAMAIIGIIYAMLHGRMNQVNEAIFQSATDAITLTISLMSVLIFWLGIMKIAEAAKILSWLANRSKWLIHKLFPEIPKDHQAIQYIVANITANLFGLGNAATPLGIKAMEEMKKLSPSKIASRSMITFLVLNSSSFTLIPTTVIAIRMQYQSSNPTEIVPTVVLASFIAVLSALILDRLFYAYDIIRQNKSK